VAAYPISTKGCRHQLNITQTDTSAFAIKVEAHSQSSTTRFFFVSDAHFDSPLCDRVKLKRDLDAAMNRDAIIVSLGDWFDAMQSRNDPRRTKAGARPEHRRDDYVNAMIDDTVDFLKPYASNIAIMAEGNHESAFRKQTGVDLNALVCQQIGCMAGGYTGFIVLRTSLFKNNAGRKVVVIAWDHGRGNGGEVTLGTIQHQRRSVMFPQADLVVSGHIHERTYVSHCSSHINLVGRVSVREQHHATVPGYLDNWNGGKGGFGVEKLKPKPIGGLNADVTITASSRPSKKVQGSHSTHISHAIHLSFT